jgi:hypothetical protein
LTGDWCGYQPVGAYTASTGQTGGNPFIGLCQFILQGGQYIESYTADDYAGGMNIGPVTCPDCQKALDVPHNTKLCNW